MNYLDFDLLLERAGRNYKARVLNSPGGQATIDFSFPFSEAKLANFKVNICPPGTAADRVKSEAMKAAKRFGNDLFNAVFKGEVRACFRKSLDEADRQGAGLRLRLRLAEVPKLIDVPWEYLHDPTLNRFFSLSVATPIVRYIDIPERIRSWPIENALRILVMIANPTDRAPLEAEREWKNLNQALKEMKHNKLVQPERLERATWKNLQNKLRENEYHIFHFIGHGDFDERNGDSMLIFEDENNCSQPVSGHALGMLLHDETTLRLALLNACEGARSGRRDPFAGIAQNLVQQGIPAVIAMQFAVTDETAVTLTHKFYDALADGYAVDAALAEARKAIYLDKSNIEWGTPVLYLRAPDGYIFDLMKTQLNGAPWRARLVVRQGDRDGQSFPLGAGNKIIGREPKLAVVLPDTNISRRHAQIIWRGGRYEIEDLGSTNGTFVNNAPLTGSQSLQHGDAIRVGNTVLIFKFDGEINTMADIKTTV